MSGGEGDSGEFARYQLLCRQIPSLFSNPPNAGYRIVLDPEGIRRAEVAATRRLEEEGLPGEWGRVGILYEDQYFLILRDAVAFPDNRLGTYIRIVRRTAGPFGVAILAVCDERVVLVRHFRHATRQWHLEVPRGFVIEGLTSEESARRELREELGISDCSLTPLGTLHTNSGLSSESVELFWAGTGNIGAPEADEAIAEVLLFAPAEVDRLIRDSHITDSFTIAAYTRAKLRGLLDSPTAQTF